ncbi:MAG: DUF3387 domain-containing protein [Gammaproteobacteria bacterium]|nr:DUF3387 domain-containing protein [Gammaproteobacteria bacterium]
MTHLGQIDIFVNSLLYRLSESGAAGACSWDWQVRDSVRVILRRHKYPPDQQQAAIELVLQQAEVLSETWSADNSA